MIALEGRLKLISLFLESFEQMFTFVVVRANGKAQINYSGSSICQLVMANMGLLENSDSALVSMQS